MEKSIIKRITESDLRKIVTESVKRILNEGLLLEYANDNKPVVCIIIGAPGAGKTTWIKHNANSFLCQQFRELDIDHTQNEFQLQTCNEVAEDLIANLSDFNDARNHAKANFQTVKRDIQTRLNNKVDSTPSKGMYINIMDIDINDMIGKRSLWEWAKNLSKIDKPEKYQAALSQFKSCFYQTYFNSIFANDFSKRGEASVKYNERVKAKLSGPNDAADEIDYNNDSICIATLGKSIEDIDWYVNQVHHTESVICVVYLNAPKDVVLTQNRKRNRSVSDTLIDSTFDNIENTWNILKTNLNNSRIWRLFRFEPLITNGVVNSYTLVENIPNQTMLNTEKEKLDRTKKDKR